MWKLALVFCVYACSSAMAALGTTTPVILNNTESAGNGDLIYLQGSGFGARPYVEYSYNDSTWIPAVPIDSGHGVVTVKIPGSETRLPDLLTFRVSPDSLNWSTPVYINRPIPRSFDTDQVAPGSTFRVFGRNLYFGRTPGVRFVDTSDGSSQAAIVNTSASTHYLLSVVAPANIKPGHSYQVFVSNGYSGNSPSIVESLSEEMLKGRAGGSDYWQLGLPWAADLNFFSNVYNIKTDPRLGNILATGDGVADDTWPIMHALQVAAHQGGGVIYLPDGHYTIHFSNGCGIPMAFRTVIQGSDASRVFINYGYPMGTPGGYGVCFASQSGLADVTIANVDVGQHWQWSGGSSSNSEVFMQRVHWNIGTSQWLNFVSDDHVAIENSTIEQGTDSAFNFLGPLNMQSCAHCAVTNSIIKFSVCGMLFDHVSDMVFEDNQVIRDISVAPDPSSVTHDIAANFVKNFTVLRNTFAAVGNALPTNNDGEVLNTEAGGMVRFDEFRGGISSATATTLTDSIQNFNQSPNTVPKLQAGIATVAIVSGEQLGQTRTVTSVSGDGQTITIDHPWDVQPEAGSHYTTFDWSAANWTIVGNTLTGNFKGFEIFSSSATNLLFENNYLLDSDGIMVSPAEGVPGYFGGFFNVIRNLDIVGNTFADKSGFRPSYVGLIPREDLQTASFGTHILGATIRANNVTGFNPNVFNAPESWDDYKVKTEGYLCDYYWQSLTAYDESAPPPLLGTVFQDNLAWNSNAAFYLNSGAAQTAISGTLVTNAKAMTEDVPILGATAASKGTTMLDGLKQFAVGSAPGSSSELIHGAASSLGGRAIEMGHSGAAYFAVGAADSLTLFGQEAGANSEIVAHISLVAGTNATALMSVRATAAPNSAFSAIGINSAGIEVSTRELTGGLAQVSKLPFTGTSVWLKLVKRGPVVTGMYSADGWNWTNKVSKVEFPGRLYLAGVAELSDGSETSINSTFSGLTFMPAEAIAPVNVATVSSPSVNTGSSPSVNTGGVRSSPNPLRRAGRSIELVAVAFWRAVKKLARHLV